MIFRIMGRDGKSGTSKNKGKSKGKASSSREVYEESLVATNIRIGLEEESVTKSRGVVYDRKIVIPDEHR